MRYEKLAVASAIPGFTIEMGMFPLTTYHDQDSKICKKKVPQEFRILKAACDSP